MVHLLFVCSSEGRGIDGTDSSLGLEASCIHRFSAGVRDLAKFGTEQEENVCTRVISSEILTLTSLCSIPVCCLRKTIMHQYALV